MNGSARLNAGRWPAVGAFAATFLVGVAACANQGAPPGGPVDVRPPVLVRTDPDTFATLTDLDRPVRFYFDERISENVTGGTLDDAVTVSPRTGDVRVGHGRTSITVEVRGGFRPGLLYRVTLQPVIRDMFGNQLRDPFELVFSTGGSASPTAVAGQAWNRTTGAPLGGALVQAVSDDSLAYVSRADQEGIFVLRYLPDGPYRVTAFEDVDRDGVLDARETQGTENVVVAAGDTLLVDVGALPSDTTPAALLSASALDSVTVALELDDYVDFESPAADVTVRIDGPQGPGPSVARVYHEREYSEMVEAVVDSLLRLDSLDAAAQAAAAPPEPAAPPDSAGAVADTTGGVAPTGPAGAPQGAAGRGAGAARVPSRPAPPRLQSAGSRAPRGGPERPLPARRLVAVLESPLEVDVEYEVTLEGVVNVNGVPGGGGDATLVRRAAPVPRPDAGAAGDTPPPASPPAPSPDAPPGAAGPTR
ncbi:MAG: Ig-like domain-containing protein [Gemmatimonadales bacterium]